MSEKRFAFKKVFGYRNRFYLNKRHKNIWNEPYSVAKKNRNCGLPKWVTGG